MFIRQKQEVTKQFLGRIFSIAIDPFCGQDYYVGLDFFEEEGVYDPVIFKRTVASQQKTVMEFIDKTKPGMLKYCAPLTLKFQIVGYIQDGGRMDNQSAGG